MSHFTVLVIGENVDEQLAPYDEGIVVAPYETQCWCVGRDAKTDADEKLNRFFEVANFRTFYWDTLDSETRKAFDKKKLWEQGIAFRQAVEELLESHHALFQKPTPDCEDCRGSGRRTTTYNPNSKWDWYVQGGRWRGFFKLKQGKTGRLGVSGAFDNEAEFDADEALKGDIDWEFLWKVKHHLPT